MSTTYLSSTPVGLPSQSGLCDFPSVCSFADDADTVSFSRFVRRRMNCSGRRLPSALLRCLPTAPRKDSPEMRYLDTMLRLFLISSFRVFGGRGGWGSGYFGVPCLDLGKPLAKPAAPSACPMSKFQNQKTSVSNIERTEFLETNCTAYRPPASFPD